MKWLTLILATLGASATAQTAIPSQSVLTAFGPPVRLEPATSPGAFPWLGRDETPTTLQQRAQRAEMVFARYPELRQQFAANPGWITSTAYKNAERRVRWEQIRAHEGQR